MDKRLEVDMRQIRAGSLFVLLLVLAVVGCNDEALCGDSEMRCASPGSESSENFESDLPPGTLDATATGRGNMTAAAAATPNEVDFSRLMSAGSAEVAREIAEADIIQLKGDRLFALSRATGLAVIDVSDPSALKLLGRHRELPATPFEMYLKDGVALVMFTGWGQYVALEDGSYDWVSTSKLVALDVQDPTHIDQLGSFDVPGSISDSRMVGEILYVIGHENGSCWRCERDKPRTSIVSLHVADARNVRKVDELFYEDANQSWGQRSVTVTSQRMYVAGPEYGQDEPTGSTIQVIDISDKNGDLVEGTSVTVRGQVDTRWQMDEYQGVLRVVSQPPRWWTPNGRVTMRPAIETFKVESSQELRALGRADIELPPNDTLRSVRFDGERGYAITAELKDPLFTLDLRDPAQPRVAGELKIPGFVYHMEPRGDRLLGLGFDRGNAAGGITVSLFDVSDMAKPAELSRVNFGGDWGSLPEDQDRIQKVFRVLDDKGFILVPFYGWSSAKRSDDSTCSYSNYAGGVQLIDFARDTLQARGSAPSEGVARRALLVEDTLISVGDEQVEALDITDRDAPERLSQLVLSRNVIRAAQLDNGVVARISSDYRKGQVLIDFVNAADAEDPNRSEAALSLSELTGEVRNQCEGLVSVEQAFVRGTTLEVLYSVYRYRSGSDQNMNTRGLLVLDASDPADPKRVANVTWQLDGWSAYSGWYRYGYYGERHTSVRAANALATLESKWERTATNTNVQRVHLRVLDLRDLDDVHNEVLPFETGTSYSGLHLDGDVVMTSHLSATSPDGRRGRFYIDRFDIARPEEPRQLSKINVPGALVVFDSASQRALTSEQVRVEVEGKLSYQDCHMRFADAHWVSDERGRAGVVVAPSSVHRSGDAGVEEAQPVVGICTGYKQRLNLVRVEDSSARLEDRIELPENQRMFSLSMGDGVLFASVSHGQSSAFVASTCAGLCGGLRAPATELLVLGGFASGTFEQGHLSVDDAAANGWSGFYGAPPVYAYGQRALLIGQSDVAIIDASHPTEPVLVERVPLIGSVRYSEVYGDSALLTLGQQGVQWLDLSDQ